MKLQVYGSHLCKDTIYALTVLTGKGADYEFIDISGGMQFMKEFLKIRDNEHTLYDAVRAKGSVGIPLFVLPDGTMTLSLEEACRGV